MPAPPDSHEKAEAFLRAEHPARRSAKPPLTSARWRAVVLGVVVLALVGAGVWLTAAGDPLADTQWRLAGVGRAGGSGPADALLDPRAYPVTLGFGGGEFRGDGPVNIYSGAYSARAGSLDLRSISRTERGGPPGAMAAEERYFALLAAAEGFEFRKSSLVSLDRDGRELLRYERVE